MIGNSIIIRPKQLEIANGANEKWNQEEAGEFTQMRRKYLESGSPAKMIHLSHIKRLESEIMVDPASDTEFRPLAPKEFDRKCGHHRENNLKSIHHAQSWGHIPQ